VLCKQPSETAQFKFSGFCNRQPAIILYRFGWGRKVGVGFSKYEFYATTEYAKLYTLRDFVTSTFDLLMLEPNS